MKNVLALLLLLSAPALADFEISMACDGADDSASFGTNGLAIFEDSFEIEFSVTASDVVKNDQVLFDAHGNDGGIQFSGVTIRLQRLLGGPARIVAYLYTSNALEELRLFTPEVYAGQTYLVRFTAEETATGVTAMLYRDLFPVAQLTSTGTELVRPNGAVVVGFKNNAQPALGTYFAGFIQGFRVLPGVRPLAIYRREASGFASSVYMTGQESSLIKGCALEKQECWKQ